MSTIDNQVIEKIEAVFSRLLNNDYFGELVEANADYEELQSLIEEYDYYDQTFEVDGKVGLKDVKGNILVPALYKDFPERYCSLFMRKRPVPVMGDNDKYALVSTDGTNTVLTPFEYDAIYHKEFTSYYICAKREGDKVLAGLLGVTGEVLVPCEMDYFYESKNGIEAFKKADKYGFYAIDGTYLPPMYDDIELQDDGYVKIKAGDKWGYLNSRCDVVDNDSNEELFCIDYTYCYADLLGVDDVESIIFS